MKARYLNAVCLGRQVLRREQCQKLITKYIYMSLFSFGHRLFYPVFELIWATKTLI